MSVSNASVTYVDKSAESPTVKHYIRETVVAVNQGIIFQIPLVLFEIFPSGVGGRKLNIGSKEVGIENTFSVIGFCRGKIFCRSVLYGTIGIVALVK